MKGYILPEPKPEDEGWFWCVACNHDMMNATEAEGHRHHFQRPDLPPFQSALMDALLDEGLLHRPIESDRELWDYPVDVVARVAAAVLK